MQCADGKTCQEEMIWTSIEDTEKGLYDDVDEICEAVHYRLSRKVLPKITDEGYVEYGLQIPHNYQTRSTSSTSGQLKKDYGPDVDWILRGSGTVSRGSAGSVHQALGVNGASGQVYGSQVSLRRSRSSDADYCSGNSPAKKNSWNRKEPIPKIRLSRDSSRHVQQSVPPSNRPQSEVAEADLEWRRPRSSSTHEQQRRYAFANEQDVENVTDDRDIQNGICSPNEPFFLL